MNVIRLIVLAGIIPFTSPISCFNHEQLGAERGCKKYFSASILVNGFQDSLSMQFLQNLVANEFNHLFVVDTTNQISPNYIVGDFNNDSINDIAILVRPRNDLNPVEKTKPQFWLGKILPGGRPRKKTNTLKATDYQGYSIGFLAGYKSNKVPLLLIIFGDKKKSWTGVTASHKFVILDAIDRISSQMQLYHGKLKLADIGDLEIISPPQLSGTALLFTDSNTGNVVYWNRGQFYWYPFAP